MGEGDAHFVDLALPDEEVRLHTRPFQPVDPAKKPVHLITATDFINMRPLSDGRDRE